LNNKVAVLSRGGAPWSAGFSEDQERRLHLRAYQYWMSLPRAGAAPLWRDFDPLMIDDRCTQSFVLEICAQGGAPNLRLIGSALRAESGVDAAADAMGFIDAPAGSLLVRMSMHFRELISRAEPLSVESEFETGDRRPGYYRGLLMPFSSDGSRIDIVFGVVSWRELESPSAAEPRPRPRIQPKR
jgi:hypothetical protein